MIGLINMPPPPDGLPVLDLGCRLGNNTQYLIERGFDVIATDFSTVALCAINKNIPKAKTMLVDLEKPLPFSDGSFKVIVADLCLHYFTEEKTKEILREIKRILKPQGILLARVNSVKDINHGAGQGTRIEENYYFVEGYNKRFFDVPTALRFFNLIGETKAIEADMLRYSKPKKVIEIISTRG
jgi:SAM-dependent methyltransferase